MRIRKLIFGVKKGSSMKLKKKNNFLRLKIPVGVVNKSEKCPLDAGSLENSMKLMITSMHFNKSLIQFMCAKFSFFTANLAKFTSLTNRQWYERFIWIRLYIQMFNNCSNWIRCIQSKF